jgi:hypothetical protein
MFLLGHLLGPENCLGPVEALKNRKYPAMERLMAAFR